MANYLLVHGAWHGAWCWRHVLPLLRSGGGEAHAVTLTGLGDRAHLAHAGINLDTHIQDVIGVIEAEERNCPTRPAACHVVPLVSFLRSSSTTSLTFFLPK